MHSQAGAWEREIAAFFSDLRLGSSLALPFSDSL